MERRRTREGAKFAATRGPRPAASAPKGPCEKPGRTGPGRTELGQAGPSRAKPGQASALRRSPPGGTCQPPRRGRPLSRALAGDRRPAPAPAPRPGSPRLPGVPLGPVGPHCAGFHGANPPAAAAPRPCPPRSPPARRRAAVYLCNTSAPHFIYTQSTRGIVHYIQIVSPSDKAEPVQDSSILRSVSYSPREAAPREASAVGVQVAFAVFLPLLRRRFGHFIPFLRVFRLLRRRPLLPPPFRPAVFEPNLSGEEAGWLR